MDLTQYVVSLTHAFEPVVREALADGVSLLPEVHELLRTQPDPWHDAATVRTFARARISEQLPEDQSWTLRPAVPNSGIHIEVPGGSFRVAVGDLDHVPSPGRSLARRAFWGQTSPKSTKHPKPGPGQLALLTSGTAAAEAIPYLNMLLLWNAEDDGAVSLAVAVPSGCWEFGAPEQVHLLAPLDERADETFGEFVAGHDDGHDLFVTVTPEEAGETAG